MKFLKKLVPSSLTAQMILLVLLALLSAQVISLMVLGGAYRSAVTNINQVAQLRQIASLVNLLEESNPSEYSSILAASRSASATFSITQHSQVLQAGMNAREKRLVRRLARRLGSDDYIDRIRVSTQSLNDKQVSDQEERRLDYHHRHTMMNLKSKKALLKLIGLKMSVQMKNGLWLNLEASSPIIPPLLARQTLLFLSISVIFVLLALVFMIRRITRPLHMLARASNTMGTGECIDILPEKGPGDIRETIRAFNQMHQRIQRFIADRTHMLAALSHDLRTPITSMRLRVEMMPNSDDRQQLLRALDEMQQMSEATLDFIRQSSDKEESRKVELNAMLGSLCDDLLAIGQNIRFIEGKETIINCRPLSLKRAFRNLIENAVKYGDQAEVSFKVSKEETDYSVIVFIQDSGPGIPDEKMKQVFEPFFRLERSRNLGTGGTGLGMAIARTIIRNHGGDIELMNNSQGLRVGIKLY